MNSVYVHSTHATPRNTNTGGNILVQVRCFGSPKPKKVLPPDIFNTNTHVYFALELRRKSPARSFQYKSVFRAAKTQKNRWRASGGAGGLVRVRRRQGAAAGLAGSSFVGSAEAGGIDK